MYINTGEEALAARMSEDTRRLGPGGSGEAAACVVCFAPSPRQHLCGFPLIIWDKKRSMLLNNSSKAAPGNMKV